MVSGPDYSIISVFIFIVGWMDKVVLLPVLKACFTYTLPDKEIRALLSSPSLASMVNKCGISCRLNLFSYYR